MAEEIIWSIPEKLLGSLEIILWIIGTVGIFVILYLIFGIINMIVNRRKKDELRKINQSLNEIKLLLSNR